MSVHVAISIARGAAHRWLHIELQSEPKLVEGQRDLDEVGTYEVTIGSRPDHHTQLMRTATFEHRYGDDVLVLVGKASDAIRAKYGNI